MQSLDTLQLQRLSKQLVALCDDMMAAENSLLQQQLNLSETHRLSARNLVDYLALRRHDIRELQTELALLGLSSLGRAESHVFSTILTVLRALNALLGIEGALPLPKARPIAMNEGSRILSSNTEALLGPAPSTRKVRIMVTMSSEAASSDQLVRDLLEAGMDCMRINCAHDGPEVWLQMIHNLRKAQQEIGRPCAVLMDLAGPKLRTGPIEPGPKVMKCRPARDLYGHVVSPARVWFTPNDKPEPPPGPASACIPVSVRFLQQLHVRDTIQLRDARSSGRTIRISGIVGRSCWGEARQTVYFKSGLQLIHKPNKPAATHDPARKIQTRVGDLPALPQVLLLRPKDILVLTRENTLGRPAKFDPDRKLITPARISISLPEMLDHAKAGEPLWLDDGKIGGVIRSVDALGATIEIVQARPEGEKLGAEKGINLPETRLDVAALTAADLEALKFVVQHADVVGYSFVRTEKDVRELLEQLERMDGQHLGLILQDRDKEGL